VPAAGLYDVAFMMDSPQFLHCFTASVIPAEVKADDSGDKSMAVKFETPDRRMTIGEAKTIHFRLADSVTGEPITGVPDVSVLYYRSDGRGRTVLPARSLGDGLYEAEVEAQMAATYYVFVGAPSMGLDYTDQPFLSLMALAAPTKSGEEVAN
jgi:hypothetical protein